MSLAKTLQSRLAGARSIAVLGVGSELRADDAAGMLVARAVADLAGDVPPARLRAFFGETAPENLTGEIRAFAPSHVLIVDAAMMNRPPGFIAVLQESDLGDAASVSTHGLPLNVVAKYLRAQQACEVTIVAIQPLSLEWGQGVSQAVAASARELAELIVTLAR
jgi:hydrogenase 3 maturation protease